MSGPEQFRDPDFAISPAGPTGFYEREFYPLSNFSSFQIVWEGVLWPTSEHAYHGSKFLSENPELAEEIRKTRSAHEAFMLARDHRDKVPDNWDEVKVEIMEEICRHKLLQHEYVKRKLLQTGDTQLVEDSPKDSFWG